MTSARMAVQVQKKYCSGNQEKLALALRKKRADCGGGGFAGGNGASGGGDLGCKVFF